MRREMIKLFVALFFLMGIKSLTAQTGTVKDADGNVYKTVSIGTQTWMTENLKTTKYKDGTSIPVLKEGNEWDPYYCWYKNDEAAYKNKYGALYNWYTVNTNNLCPSGWHVPTDAEWTTLTDYLGGLEVSGAKIKSKSGWPSNGNGTDVSGFSALPGGSYYDGVGFQYADSNGLWWSSTEIASVRAWVRTLNSENNKVARFHNLKQLGFSVRCIKD